MSNQIISASFPPELAERLRAFARRDDRTVSYVVRRFIEDGLEKNGDGAPESTAAKDPAGRGPNGVKG